MHALVSSLGLVAWLAIRAADLGSTSSLPAFFEALRLLLSRCHARRAAVAQTSPACAYCRRRPRRPHPRRLQESHQFGQESRAALLLSLACGTHCSVRGCNLVTPRLSAAAHAAPPATWRSSPPTAAPRRASADLVAETQRYVRNWGRSGSARIALETTLMTLKRHPGSSFRG